MHAVVSTSSRNVISLMRTDICAKDLIEGSRRPEVVDAMREFYARIDRQIAEKPATCWNHGDCCRFAQFGHRLYVTALEVCYYLATGDAPPPVTGDTCPHAYEGKCHARERRPLGCRIFFCDPLAQAWQGPFTEEHLAVLRELHDELGVRYFYADWMDVLRALRTPEKSFTR